ncbi:ZZ-type zinc finger-containing protein 3-like [Orbicella faveolata]|uniref:ZZ-type zinc finger-containing protein 3-like n=1 Tax=Orbicella faveolata TaxID=48498 RepID=UPI0009E4AC4B|nr:ZZ-type zinc finger-containing protein 3-like [Orbicella faveolata]
MKVNTKTNESSPAVDKENQSLKLCSTAAAFGATVTKDRVTKTEIKTETNISDEDVEVDLDVGSNDCLYNRASDLFPTKSDNSNRDSVIRTVTNKAEEDDEADVDVGSNSALDDQGSQQISIKISSARTETFEERADKEVSGLEKESSAKGVNMWYDQVLVHDEAEDDHYDRFYFESDHLALKDNKHYHLLLQTLLVLESQRSQAVKDLDVLYQQQAKALQDPISFVEKLQNKEHLDLPSCQKVVKLPSIPWEEYTVSLSTIDRERLSNPHLTRAASNNLGKANEPSIQTSDTGEFASAASSESNVYSVFGGEFVASKQGKPLERESLTSVFTPRNSEFTNGKLVRGRHCDEMKPVTFNQPWTAEEQAKLEKLLQIYPQEEVEAKRWEKIAAALGNRTFKQVASRVQKYFIKLARAGLPVPGRMPNLPRPGNRSKRSSHYYQTLGFRNSTFFPSYQPKVLMDEEDDISSVATDDTAGYLSDEESVPVDLRHTEEYRELLELKRLKRQKIADFQQTEEKVQHSGFMCDGCGISPISGTRWHCIDCSKDTGVDFCTECAERGNINVGSHTSEHQLEPITRNSTFFVDGDYLGLSGGSTSAGYNYLDTNFLPSAS